MAAAAGVAGVNILNLIKNAKHFSVRFSYTDRNRRLIIANLVRIGIDDWFIVNKPKGTTGSDVPFLFYTSKHRSIVTSCNLMCSYVPYVVQKDFATKAPRTQRFTKFQNPNLISPFEVLHLRMFSLRQIMHAREFLIAEAFKNLQGGWVVIFYQAGDDSDAFCLKASFSFIYK